MMVSAYRSLMLALDGSALLKMSGVMSTLMVAFLMDSILFLMSMVAMSERFGGVKNLASAAFNSSTAPLTPITFPVESVLGRLSISVAFTNRGACELALTPSATNEQAFSNVWHSISAIPEGMSCIRM